MLTVIEVTTETTTEATTEASTTASSSSGGSGGGGGGSGSTRFVITFEPNNGEDATTKYVARNTAVSKIATPEYEGYTFLGWFTDEDFTEEYDFDTKVTSSFTLYAGWKSDSDSDDETEETAESDSNEEETNDSIDGVFTDVIG
ncbi:MAG: InlB B-repeat-containing protein, partial [Eubacterium sp.]|nr:InlB B-repeat-containing protein [Eubacterium sp.]